MLLFGLAMGEVHVYDILGNGLVGYDIIIIMLLFMIIRTEIRLVGH